MIGCGKSTLLAILGQVLTPTHGQVLVHGKAVGRSDHAQARARNRTFGYLVQDFALVEGMSARGNVELPLHYAQPRPRRAARAAVVRVVLEALDIGYTIDQEVRLLSGGERQRVALARALINDPSIILADEPTGALDSANGVQVFELLRTQADKGRAVLVVTHEHDLARLCDRVLLMRDGRIVSDTAVRTPAGP